MEFVGKTVTKKFKGFGVFEGIVESYDSSTGFFKILYEDGDSEEADLSDVSRLVSSSSSSYAAHLVVENQKSASAKKVGRPKKRRRNGPGKSCDVLAVDISQHNLVIENRLGHNAVNGMNAPVNVNGNLDEIVGNDGLDLNRGLNFDDVAENAEIRGCIDLNLSVNDDEFYQTNEHDNRCEKIDSLAKKVHGFDLNLGVNEESLNGVSGTVDINTCIEVGEEVKKGDTSGLVDANRVNNWVYDAQLEGGGPEAASPGQCQDGTTAQRKRRKVGRKLRSPAETVLRRSARRAKVVATDENNAPSTALEDDPNDFSMSGVIDEIEEKPAPQMLKIPIESQVSSSNIELPPSSAILTLEGIPVLDVFSVYSFLRSFSTILYLSPFELEDFVAALKSRVSNQLIDLTHVSILLTLKKHLDLLASEGCESASTCLRNLNWDLLDEITWPVFMVEYLLLHGSRLKPGFTLSHLNLFDGEYYKQPAEVKIELLRCLCDDVVEVDPIRSELTKRTILAEANMEAGRTTCNGKKKKTSLETPGESCLTEDLKEDIADGNSDECCLCKMDGNLICCDGCPAAYHSKCVGIVSSLLPEGDWFCPECVIGGLNFVNKRKKSVRGAELLGTDPYGRLFFSCFDYLLVSDSYDAEAVCSYYHKDDLGAVIQLLRSSSILYGSILSAICQRWGFLVDVCQPKNDLGSENYTAKPFSQTENLSSEGFGEVLQESGSIKKSGRPVSCIATSRAGSKQRKKKGSARKGRSVLKAKEEDVLQGQSGDVYINCYNFALTASSVVEELLRKPSGKISIDVPKTEEEIISIQLKFILNKSAKSCWPNIQDLNRERQKEKCGWCYCCRFPVEGRGCLFSVKNSSPVSDALKVEIEGILSKKNKKRHLVDVISYIIYMEERLRGFLAGPWLRPQYSELWRKRVLKASDVLSLKLPLLMLESNLRPLALSVDWWKHVDLVTTMGSATHFVASSRATSKNGINRKKFRYAGSESKSSNSSSGLVLFWWRGGKTSRRLFSWKVIPHSLAMKVARKAGCMKIPDIQYPEASENARRTKCFAWRAAVETSTSVEQLALQVREFDLFIRWDDIENTYPHSLLDKESIKSIRLFKKVIIRRKRLEGPVAKYLLDFGKRRSVPDVVLKHGQKFEEPSSERKKYWLDEEYVPLNLLKSFEERRISRKVGKANSRKFQRSEKVTKKPLRENGFDYLFSRAERADSYQCGHCNKNVPISEAVRCQFCNGFFHKRHVMKSSEGITAGCTYTCHRCRAGKHARKESNLGKRKLSKLRDLKILKVDSERHSATLRAKPRKKRKTSASTNRQVLLRNAEKMPCHEQTLSQKTTNVSIGINLRRSARKAKCTTVHSNRFAKGKKTKTNKLRKVESPKGFLWKKKRTHILHSCWINGLLLSTKLNDERVVQFKKRKLIVPSEFFSEIDVQPKCSLCSQQGSAAALMYIACEICGDWFHGDAFGLNKGNIGSLIGFKCHICRDRSPPVCPFVDISRDKNILSIESEPTDAKELPDVMQKERNHVQELQCNDDPSGLLEAQAVQNCDETLDQDDTVMLDSEFRVENESLTCKEVASSSVKSQDVNLEARVLKESDYNSILEGLSGLLEAHTAQTCDGTLDQDKMLMLDSKPRLENESLTCMEVASCSFVSQDVNLEGKVLKEPDDNSISKDPSGVLEAHIAQNCDGTLDQDETLMLDSELRVENKSFTCKEVASCSVESQDIYLEAKVLMKSDSNIISVGSSRLLEARTTQNCDGTLNLDETLMPDSGLRVESKSLTCKEVASCSVESQDLNLESMKESDDNISSGDPSGLLKAHAEQNSDGTLDQDETLILDSELRVEKGSITCKEVASCSVESQDVNMEAKLLEEPDDNVISDPCGLVKAHKAQSCDGIVDQDDTPRHNSELRVKNESITCKQVVSCSVESQDVNLEAQLLQDSADNSISEGI